jgi:hypothetical protein
LSHAWWRVAALILARPREQQTRPPRSRVHRLSRIFTIVSDRIRRFGFVQSHPKNDGITYFVG